MKDITEETGSNGSHYFGVEAQIKTVVQKRQSDLNPLFASPVHKDVNHENCMFILVHQSQLEHEGASVFTADTDELTDAQYASYLEFSENYSRNHLNRDQPYYRETISEPPIFEGGS